VRRPPGVVVVAPRVGAGLDGDELVVSLGVGQRATDPGEVRVQWARPVVRLVPVAAARVGLPDLHQRVRHRAAVAVAQRAVHDDPLADRLAGMLPGQVVVQRTDPAGPEHRAGDLGEPLRQQDQGLAGVAQRGGPVAGEVQRRLVARWDRPVPRQGVRRTTTVRGIWLRGRGDHQGASSRLTGSLPWCPLPSLPRQADFRSPEGLDRHVEVGAGQTGDGQTRSGRGAVRRRRTQPSSSSASVPTTAVATSAPAIVSVA